MPEALKGHNSRLMHLTPYTQTSAVVKLSVHLDLIMLVHMHIHVDTALEYLLQPEPHPDSPSSGPSVV